MGTTNQMIQRKTVVPAGRDQRTGLTEVLDYMYYDTILYGAGQILQPENGFFNEQLRANKLDLCNLVVASILTDQRQFCIYRIGLQVWSETSPSFYEQFVFFSRFEIKMDVNRKLQIWGDQLPSGGGISGYDNNAAAFHLTNGNPQSTNQFQLQYGIMIFPNESFQILQRFMAPLFPGTVGAYSALSLINANTEDNRLVRMYIRGVEGRNPLS